MITALSIIAGISLAVNAGLVRAAFIVITQRNFLADENGRLMKELNRLQNQIDTAYETERHRAH